MIFGEKCAVHISDLMSKIQSEDYCSGRRFATPTFCNSTALWLPTSIVRPLWCGRYGAAVKVRPLWCGDSMVLVFYGARQYGAIVSRIFLLFGIFGGPYKGRFVS